MKIMRSTPLFCALILAVSFAASAATVKEKEADRNYNSGVECFDNKDYSRAAEFYEKAIELNPEHADAYYGLGITYVQQKEFKKAFVCFEEALFIDPDHADAHYGMGIVCPIVIRDNAKAIEHYEKYLKLKPDAPDREKVTQWIAKLKIKGKAHWDEDMIAQYNKGIESFDAGKFDEAEFYCKEALKLNPHYAPAHHALALAYARTGRRNEAAKELEEVLMIDPRDAEAHYDLGVIYPVIGEKKKGADHYRAYLRLKPDAPDRKKVEGLIIELEKK